MAKEPTTAGKPAAARDVVTIVARAPIDHDGVRYHDGDAIDMTQSQAAALVGLGVAEMAPAAAPAA